MHKPLSCTRPRLSVRIPRQLVTLEPTRLQELRTKYAQMKQTQLHHYALRRPDGNRPDDPINCVKAKVATDALQHAIGAKAKHMEELAHAVDETHASVRVMEYAAAANVGMQGVGTQDLVGLCAEIQKTQQTIKAQHVEMQKLKKINE